MGSIESNGSSALRGSFTTTEWWVTTQQAEDPIKLLQMRLAKGEITPEQYQASLKDAAGRLKEGISFGLLLTISSS